MSTLKYNFDNMDPLKENEKIQDSMDNHLILNINRELASSLIPRITYTKDENMTWNKVSSTLADLYPEYVCKEYRHCFNLLRNSGRFGLEAVPQVSEVSEFLRSRTGFTLVPAKGYLNARDFFTLLAFRMFPCTQFIRNIAEAEYTCEGDCCHELLGHVPMLIDPEFADLTHAIGMASVGANDDIINQLQKIYFFTVEFGLCCENGMIKGIGAGLLGSSKELKHAVEGTEKQHPFNLQKVIQADIMMTTYQNQYFVIESFEAMKNILRDFHESITKTFNLRFDLQNDCMHIENRSPKTDEQLNSFKSKIDELFGKAIC